MLNNPLSQARVGQTGFSFFQTFIPALISIGLIIGAIIFFFMLVIGGIRWGASSGDKPGIEAARTQVINALVGLTVLFGLYVILRVVFAFFFW